MQKTYLVQCYKTIIRKRTSVQCNNRGKPLCPGECFGQRHNDNMYVNEYISLICFVNQVIFATF